MAKRSRLIFLTCLFYYLDIRNQIYKNFLHFPNRTHFLVFVSAGTTHFHNIQPHNYHGYDFLVYSIQLNFLDQLGMALGEQLGLNKLGMELTDHNRPDPSRCIDLYFVLLLSSLTRSSFHVRSLHLLRCLISYENNSLKRHCHQIPNHLQPSL